jgi:hypothetical protein
MPATTTMSLSKKFLVLKTAFISSLPTDAPFPQQPVHPPIRQEQFHTQNIFIAYLLLSHFLEELQITSAEAHDLDTVS